MEKEVADSLATEEVGRFFAALAPLLDAVTTSPKLADFILQTLDKISDPQLKKIFLNRLEIERRELNDWIDKLDSFLKEWEQNRVVREIIAIDHAEIASIIQDLESTRTEIDTAISGSNQMVPEEENDEADENENQPATSPQRAAPYNESDENNSGEIIPVLSNNQNKENLDLVGNRQTEGNANNQSVNPFIRASELNTVIHKSVSEIATDGIPRRFASNVKKLFKGE
ncbi:MAG: hypothetical protein COU69_00625 [Candidatus Pacebacteria bacterium CG10_big_fil_rev_8_21_14_0_10_56_10]|nr:MAG: hypothetical protein COU69_00625 [Candidatus Pacebacteria bacterium CG10_big_fil_rev_8_21_14_0_10_56_10]